MRSPFPGMDPYLERPGIWETFHGALAPAIMAALNRQIRPKYIAQIDLVRLPAVEVRKQRVVKIFDKVGGELITAIEVLSRADKNPKEDFEQYCLKREQYRTGHVNLVEIDLLRRGKRMPADEPLPPANYYVFVCRAGQRDRAEVWPIRLRDRLPEIPIPLGDDDPDARLDLQSLRDRVFDEAGWLEEDLYDWKLKPPLRGADAEWAGRVLAQGKSKTAGRRSQRGSH